VTGAAGGVGGAAVAMAARLGCHVIGATGNVEAKGAYIKSLGNVIGNCLEAYD
jgi:NADPH:quinone reductase-like Zn-dependent oxidoreductase